MLSQEGFNENKDIEAANYFQVAADKSIPQVRGV